MTENNRKPDYIVYIVTQPAEKDFWHRIGAAWSHSKEDGLNIRLDYPVGATDFVLLPPKDENA